MKGIKYRLNIDKLTLCYVAQKEIVDDLENTKEWISDGFRIDKLENIETNNEIFLKVSILDPFKEETYKEYAIIKIGNRFEKEDDNKRYVWIMIDNKVFYGYKKYSNDLSYIYYIAESLNHYGGVVMRKYTKTRVTNFFQNVVLMDNVYKSDGKLTNMWY